MVDRSVTPPDLVRLDSLETPPTSDGSGSSSQSSPSRSTDLATEMIYNDSYQIAVDVVRRACGQQVPYRASKLVAKMRALVDDLSNKHGILLQGMVKRLCTQQNGTSTSPAHVLRAVGDEMFTDGKVNWGRIVALYAFVARWSAYVFQSGQHKDMPDFAQILATYVAQRLGEWLAKQGGWDALLTAFPEQIDWESKLFTGLVIAGVGLGVLAGFIALR